MGAARARRALPSILALGLAALVGLASPRVQADEAAAASAPPAGAWSEIPLTRLGLGAYTRRKWRAPTLTLRYQTRLDRLVTAARLRIALASTHPIADRLRIALNGVPVAELSAVELHADDHAQPRLISIDPRLFTADNNLTFTWIGAEPTCVPEGRWDAIAPQAALEVQKEALSGSAPLADLPLPLVDPALDEHARIPFVFAAAPSRAALRAAFVLAGGFALAAPAELSFPVRFGSLPPGHAVVVGTPDALAALGIAAGPPVRMVPNPAGSGQLLVVSGPEGELPKIAAGLARKLAGPPPGPPRTGDRIAFSQLVPKDRLILHGRHDGQITIPFTLPPATLFWPEEGMPVTLAYEESVAQAAPPSSLVVSLNGHYVTTLQHWSSVHAAGWREARFRLPQPFLARHNRLVVSWELAATRACPTPHPEESFTVRGDSTLGLAGSVQLGRLPDLGELARSGFPFTRAPDLGATLLVLAPSPSPQAIATLLDLGARLARLAGTPSTGASLASRSALAPGLDRDLIVIDGEPGQPLIAPLGPDRPLDPRDRSLGVVASFESPLHPGRTVLALLASTPGALPAPGPVLAAALAAPPSDRALVRAGEVKLESRAPSYLVGRLGKVQRVMWFLSLRPWLLILFLLGGVLWLSRLALIAAARRARGRLTLICLLLLSAQVAHADEVQPDVLEARAHFWEKQGRCDKAREVWLQLLRLSPESAAARAGLTSRCATEAAPVDHAAQAGLARARALARTGRYPEAVKAYRAIFGEHPPENEALEFYQTLAGTQDGRPEAGRALAELAAHHPNDPRYALAYARALSYSEATRRDGIARLAALAKRPEVGVEAQAAWRLALGWLAAHPADRPFFDRYLASHPDDRELKDRRAAIDRSGPGPLALGYARLHAGANEEAAAIFSRELTASPQDPRPLVGLAWVRLAERRSGDARAFAERARALAPDRPSVWREALAQAGFYAGLAEADRARTTHDLPAAQAALDRAETAWPPGKPQVALLRGRLLLGEGQPVQAEALLQPLVDGGRIDALPDLIEAMIRRGESAQADRTIERSLARSQASAAELKRTRIAIARGRARALSARGDDEGAIAALRRALAIDPHDRQTHLDLLGRELDSGATETALALGESLRRAHPEDPEVLTALARAEEASHRLDAALATLLAIDPGKLDPDGRALADRLSFETRLAAAVARPRSPDRESALDALEREAALAPEWLALTGAAFLKAGFLDRALSDVHRALAEKPPRGVKLRCAAILLDAGPGQADALTDLLDQLSDEPDLSQRERRAIDALRTALLVRRADADRESGDYRRAFSRLDPALAAHPEEPSLLAALARLQASAGHPAQAYELFARLAARDPKDLSLLEGEAFSAVASGKRARAEELARAAVTSHGSDPRAYLIAGRVEVALGDDPAGYQLFERGLARVQDTGASAPSDPDSDRASFLALTDNARSELAPGATDDHAQPQSTGEALRLEAQKLDERYAPTARADLSFRFRSGDPGLSRLFEVSLPLALDLSPKKRHGQLTLGGTPVYLTSESADLSSTTVAGGFGSNAAHPTATLPLRLATDSWGFALSVGYRYRGLTAEVGSTPLGFLVPDAVGQLGWQGQAGAFSFGVRGFREAVRDSVLSYGGLRDPRSGIVWGGVRREGGQLDAGYDPGAYHVRLFVAYAAYTGRRVATNSGGQYGLSALFRVYQTPRHQVELGGDLFAMNFSDNLRYFTFGQGGYFSPQFFFFAGVPLHWKADLGDWKLNAGLEAGVNWYDESTSPLFPADGNLQAAGAAAPDLGLPISGGRFPAIERIGPYGKLRLGFQRDLGGHFTLSGALDAELAPAYDQVLLTMAIHKAFL